MATCSSMEPNKGLDNGSKGRDQENKTPPDSVHRERKIL